MWGRGVLMRAAVVSRYGPPDVVRVEELAAPEPGKGDVLVRISAAAVTSADSRIRGARFPGGFAPFARVAFGFTRPRRQVLGGTFSGVVEALGSQVTGLAVGDEVCGMNGLRMGTHAELAAVPAKLAVRKPATVSHDDAAGVLFGGSTALHYLRSKAEIGPGTKVLVNGASGAIGTNAVQLARHWGAVVTAVTSAGNSDLVTRLGATHVIDHGRTSLAEVTERYDVVLDTVGNISPAAGRRLLTETGVLLLAVATLGQTIGALTKGNVKAGPAPEKASIFEELLAMVGAGELEVVLDQVHDLDDIAAAHARVDTGHKVGNVIVRP